MTESTRQAIEAMVERIVRRFSPEKIILFGSHARGGAGPEGDVDLLVVMAVEGSLCRQAIEIDQALVDREVPLDSIVVTPETFERDRDPIGTIIRPAAREGRVPREIVRRDRLFVCPWVPMA